MLKQNGTPILGAGLALKASKVLGTRKEYQDYVIDTQSNGQTPETFEVWSKKFAK